MQNIKLSFSHLCVTITDMEKSLQQRGEDNATSSQCITTKYLNFTITNVTTRDRAGQREDNRKRALL